MSTEDVGKTAFHQLFNSSTLNQKCYRYRLMTWSSTVNAPNILWRNLSAISAPMALDLHKNVRRPAIDRSTTVETSTLKRYVIQTSLPRWWQPTFRYRCIRCGGRSTLWQNSIFNRVTFKMSMLVKNINFTVWKISTHAIGGKKKFSMLPKYAVERFSQFCKRTNWEKKSEMRKSW